MTAIHPVKLAYEGVLIERPCMHCDTVNIHYPDGQCQDGPCTVCGVKRRDEGHATHPRNADGTWSPRSESEHDWTPHTYAPADITIESEAFKQMLRVVQRTGWPKSYTSDLFRDWQNLTGQGAYKGKPLENERFIWVLREMGTHMFLPDGYGRAGLKYHIDNAPEAEYFLWSKLRGLLPLRNGETAGTILALPPISYTRTTRPGMALCHGPGWHDGTCTHTEEVGA